MTFVLSKYRISSSAVNHLFMNEKTWFGNSRTWFISGSVIIILVSPTNKTGVETVNIAYLF
jgi:hypothetical protein